MQDATWSQTILESMTDGVLTLDQQGLLAGLNPAAAEILGLDSEQVEGRPYAEIFFALASNDDFNQIILDLVASGEARTYAEVPFQREDGEERMLAVTSSLLRDDRDQRLGAVLVFKDISAVHKLRRQRDELAQELKEKHDELTKAYLDLEERNQALQERSRRVFVIKLVAGVLGLAAFAMIIYLGWGQDLDGPESAAAPSAAQGAGSAELRQAESTQGDIMVTISTNGFVEPLKVVRVTARVGGEVMERHVDLGRHMSAGELLFRLDKGEVLPKVREAEARVLRAQDKVRELEGWSHGSETQQARRSVDLAQMDMERKQKRYQEAQRLFDEGIIPANDLENARSDLIRAQAELAAAHERLSEARERGSADKLKVARLELMNAQATLGEAREMLADTEVRASSSGVVMRPEGKGENASDELPEVGSRVTEGQELAALGADRPLGVVVPVPEAEIGKVAIGQKALVSTRALEGGPLEAVVRSVAPQADTDNKQPSFPVVVEITDMSEKAADKIRLGMSAAVRIVVSEARGAVLVPIVAVSQRQEGMAVRVKKDGETVWQPVTTGLNDHEFVQITDGLEPGQKVFY